VPHGPVQLKTHAMIEPLAAILLIVAPWLIGFNDIESCTIASVVVGAVMLLSGMTTRWRYSVAKLVPLRTHYMTDLLLGVVLIATPFVAGASDRGDATRFLVIMGVLELMVAVTTNWDQREEVVRTARSGATSTAR
jgi:uncharacterized membrane protein HdeD (DUF308 family)